MFYAFNIHRLKKLLCFLFVAAAVIAAAYQIINILFPVKHGDMVFQYAEQYGLPPELVCAVINAESRFDTDAKSHRGASGLMQIIPQTADWGANEIGIENYSYDRIFEPEINIRIGCWYISKLTQQYGGETATAIAAYNAGSGTVSGWLKDARYSSDGKTLSEIPYGETRQYVDKVMRYIKVYKVILNMKGE